MALQDALTLEAEAAAKIDAKPLSFWRIAWMRLWKDKLSMVAIFILLLIAVLALGADIISTNILGVNPDRTNLIVSFEGPSAENWLGTDALGRDQLARLLIGGRISLAIGFFGALFTLLIGLVLGVSAAFFGGWVDDTIMWLINTLGSIPQLFLLLLVGALFELSPAWLTVLFALLGWPFITRLVRSNVLSMREREYIEASRALGASSIYIMVRHIVPNVLPIVIIATTRTVGNLMLSEAALSFLGFGVQPPTATWGAMLTKAQQFILRPDARHLVWAPGVMITITVLCMFIIGDGLRDAMDPRLK
jgi:ABC-type dipeptide/oligopeptide/nickel transport system permease subunit